MRDKQTPKPSKGRNKDGFSIADLISIIGLVALAFFLYLGYTYSGTNSGTSVLLSILITIGIALILYALLYAKRVENNFEKWRRVEYGLVAVFVAACVATIPTLCHFINVNRNSSELKDHALADLGKMENAISNFQDQERANLSQLEVGLQNVASASNYYSATTDELKEYIANEIIGDKASKLNKENISSFTEKWNGHIDNLHHYGEGKSYATTLKDAIDKNRKRVENWKIFEIPQAIEDIDRLGKELGTNLNSISESYPLHKIGRTGSQYDIVDKHTAFSASVNSNFKDECSKQTGVNFSGAALSVVIFLLIIFSYLVAYRSTKISVKAGSSTNDGGIILKPNDNAN